MDGVQVDNQGNHYAAHTVKSQIMFFFFKENLPLFDLHELF